MTCRRLEGRDSLADLVEAPDRHTQHCPDCSARLRGYQRMARWIAEGKTSHRASADWRRRTLAQLRAAASGRAQLPSASSASSASGQSGARAQSGGRAPSPLVEVTLPDPTRPRALVPSVPPPSRARLLAVVALSSAAIVVVTLVAVMTRDGESTVQIAIGTDPARPSPISPPGEASISPSGDRPQADPPSNPAPSASAGSSQPIGRAQGASKTSGPGPDDSPGRRRGVNVTIDIPSADPAGSAQSTIDVSIVTNPPGAGVVLDGAVLGTTPYRGTLPRSERQLKLAISLADFLDEVITVDASRPITRNIQLVPIQRHR
jgi:hypothetical protein